MLLPAMEPHQACSMRYTSVNEFSSSFLVDILALCTRLRPVVMVDYGGKIPELTEHLCKLLDLCHEV